jgi:hypothetical protein
LHIPCMLYTSPILSSIWRGVTFLDGVIHYPDWTASCRRLIGE